jgi:hypothetical protein
MSHQDIIQTLIEWIDEHIDQPLNIDVVARKSGYSKWYLQRMFRTVMHQTLGDYIRQRRCCWRRKRYEPPSGLFLISRWIWATCRSKPSPGCSAASLTVRQRLSPSDFRLTRLIG